MGVPPEPFMLLYMAIIALLVGFSGALLLVLYLLTRINNRRVR